MNQVIEQYLRIFLSYQQDDWINYLPLAEFSYNNTIHQSTRMTPFYAARGYHPRFESSLLPITIYKNGGCRWSWGSKMAPLF